MGLSFMKRARRGDVLREEQGYVASEAHPLDSLLSAAYLAPAVRSLDAAWPRCSIAMGVEADSRVRCAGMQ